MDEHALEHARAICAVIFCDENWYHSAIPVVLVHSLFSFSWCFTRENVLGGRKQNEYHKYKVSLGL